jgi:taurine dioxygenase
VHGFDARVPLEPDDLDLIRRVLAERQVLFMRGQDLSAAEHLTFASQFGPLAVDPVAALKGQAKTLSYIEDTEARPPAEFPWHTDLSWLQEPPAFGILNARVIPDFGGDTMWVDLCALYDALPEAMKERIRPLQLRHRPKLHYFETVRRHNGDELVERLIAENPPIAHPLVRAHPTTGRPALFLCPLYADTIVGLSEDESAELLGELEARLDDVAFQIRWRWEPFDLVIWDEASTNHRALGDHYPRRRLMQRCAVGGSAPLGYVAP